MPRKQQWSVVRVQGTEGDKFFIHGRKQSFLSLYADDVGAGVRLVVLRNGKPLDRGRTVAKKGRAYFAGLKNIRPYELEPRATPGEALVHTRLERVFKDCPTLYEGWFHPGDIIRLKLPPGKLWRALDRPF